MASFIKPWFDSSLDQGFKKLSLNDVRVIHCAIRVHEGICNVPAMEHTGYYLQLCYELSGLCWREIFFFIITQMKHEWALGIENKKCSWEVFGWKILAFEDSFPLIWFSLYFCQWFSARWGAVGSSTMGLLCCINTYEHITHALRVVSTVMTSVQVFSSKIMKNAYQSQHRTHNWELLSKIFVNICIAPHVDYTTNLLRTPKSPIFWS